MADDKPPPEDLDSTQTFEQDSGPPQRIGNYRILQKLGEGGMGVVYLAEQEKPIRRRVALKIIKLGMDTKAVIARFEAERQALALMNHPNVAKVFEAGTTEQGRPYFVMEYVKGVPITTHCDRQRLTTTDRLRLFMQACEGVQHAHQKGIIHRDLKPSNVLVAIEGETAMPKIIDFGVAKATEHRLTEQTLFTQLGQIIGTPEYMSPEQAEMTTQDIDTRTDVYSLGVILYELLVGALPFDPRELRQAGFDEIRRRIREEEPSRPSTRVTTVGESSTEAATQRRTDPASLAKQLRGDLDWITMKALEKARTRRYASAAALALDVDYFLSHQPVTARPPSTYYRVGKFVRRHRWGVSLVLSLGLALIAGTIGTTVGFLRARHEAQKARAVTNHLIAMVSEANPEKAQGRQVTVRDAIDASSAAIGKSFAGQPELEMEVRATVATLYHAVGAYAEAEEHLRHSVELAERELGPRNRFTLGVRGKLGRTLMESGRYENAESEMRALLPLFRKTLGDDDPETLSVANNLAAVYLHQKRYDEAEPLLLEVTKRRRETFGSEHVETQSAISNLAQLYVFTKRYDEAEPLMREGLIVRRRELGNTHPHTLISVFNLGDLYLQSGRPAQAESLILEALDGFRDVVGETHPYSLEALGGLVRVLVDLDRLEEAEAPARDNYRLRAERFGADHAYSVEAMDMLIEVLEGIDQPAEAARLRGSRAASFPP